VTGLPIVADREFIDFQQAVAGRYSLERELGRGGMGIVYLARELRLARAVAIKLLPRDLAAAKPELRERFVREAQMAAQLSHPNVVPIHHVDEIGEFVFFVMAFIDGETLGERLRARGPLPPHEASRVLRDVGWALAYAQLRGIVHRDVKPDNILLERATGRAVVTDFGIAGDVATASTADGGYVRGTVHYLSPEQAAGAAVDGRSDLYSLGVTGYYAVTGRLPFEAENAMGVMVAHASRRPTAIASVAPTVPHRLASAIERCLEKLPERRWETGEQFAEAVDAAVDAPRELPTPLRVWLGTSAKERGMRIAVAIYASMGIVVTTARGAWPVGLMIGLFALLLMFGPALFRLRRLLAGGFSLADVRAAVATDVVRRREELIYESSSAFSIRPRKLQIIGGTLFASGVAGAITLGVVGPLLSAGKVNALGPLTALVAIIGTLLGVIGLVKKAQMQGGSGWLSGGARVKFWGSTLGARFAALAAIGLKRGVGAVHAPALPQHTEVALGRALDALFESLPKQTRRELKDVPKTVQRLEEDARALRAAVDKLDEAIDAADRAGQPDHLAKLKAERETANMRLANAVTALETIRLGLLRLQLGAAPVASVTEAIEAASRVGDELNLAASAAREASEAIRPR